MDLSKTLLMLPLLPRIVFIHWIFLCLLQFFIFPIIAIKIRNHLTNINVKINSNPYFSFNTRTKFWKEAKEINGELNDEKLTTFLKYKKFCYGYYIVSFICWPISIFLTMN